MGRQRKKQRKRRAERARASGRLRTARPALPLPPDPDATLAAVAAIEQATTRREPVATRPIVAEEADDAATVVVAAVRRQAASTPRSAADLTAGDRASPAAAPRPQASIADAATQLLPAAEPVRRTWAERRAINREWQWAERAGAAGLDGAAIPDPREHEERGVERLVRALRIPRSLRGAGSTAGRGMLARRMPYPILAALLLVSLIVGFIGTQSVLQLLDAKATASDAKAQVLLIEDTLKGGDPLQTTRLTDVQTHLTILENDITRIRADIPFESLVSGNATVAAALHLLTMAQDLAQAGSHGVAAALILAPGLKGMLHGLGGDSTGSPSPPSPPSGGLTAAQVNTATADVNAATVLLRQALVERTQISAQDLQSLGLASVVPLLTKLDAQTPKLGAYLAQAHTLMAALPALLGIGTPINYLLFNMDSDELRPTGGFLGNYAVLTLSGGKLASGVHLHDIMELDCPNSNCYPRTLPPQFAWFPFAQVGGTQIFDVRDSNLDPDFPTSAKLAELFAQQEGAPPLGGVIAITPGLIERVLQVTGPIRVAPLDVTVTAANLQDEIHYFHILYAYCIGYPSAARCAQLNSPALQQYQTSGRKVFDAVLGSTLLHALGSLPPQRQSALYKAILTSLQTKDLQVYLNDPRMEALLSSYHIDGAVETPPSDDSLFIVDTNISATYVNGDVQERAQDTVTLDAQGNATHDLTIAYDYPVVPHIWSAIYPAAGGSFMYRDVARVIVPQPAQLDATEGCYAPGAPAPEAGHAVFACTFALYRQNTLTLHLRWTVPHAAVTAHGSTQYTLLLEKQAGTQTAMSVTIRLPLHAHLTAAPSSPLVPDKSGAAVQYVGTLDTNQTLVVTYR